MNFSTAISRCDDNAVKMQLKRIESYKEYCCLFETTFSAFLNSREMFEGAPLQIRAWYKCINGGLLFDTLFLSTQRGLNAGELQIPTISVFNYDIVKKTMGVPSKYIVFALASFGDLYCFSIGDQEIIQWSVSERKIMEKWSSFFVWLKQEIDTAIEMIADDIMLPLGIYSEEGSL